MIDSENAGTNGYNDLSCDDDYSFGDKNQNEIIGQMLVNEFLNLSLDFTKKPYCQLTHNPLHFAEFIYNMF